MQKAIQSIANEFAKLSEKSKVPLRVIRYHLGNVLETGSPQEVFLTSGVTFCGLRPMRSVNARVICMIGMNEGAFPRQTKRPNFDLSGLHRPGDRSARRMIVIFSLKQSGVHGRIFISVMLASRYGRVWKFLLGRRERIA